MENAQDIKNRFLKETNAKNERGTVYGNVKNVVGYHKIGSYDLKDKKTLLENIETLETQIKELENKIKILKEVVVIDNKKIVDIERKLKKYGLE